MFLAVLGLLGMKSKYMRIPEQLSSKNLVDLFMKIGAKLGLEKGTKKVIKRRPFKIVGT